MSKLEKPVVKESKKGKGGRQRKVKLYKALPPASKPHIICVDVRALILAKYQRDEKNADELAENWKEAACDPIMITRGDYRHGADQWLTRTKTDHPKNCFHVVNGQRRALAQFRCGRTKIWARLVPSKDLGGDPRSEEARLFFASARGVRSITTFEAWRAAIEGNDSAAVGAQKVLKDLGVRMVKTVRKSYDAGEISCVNWVLDTFRKFGEKTLWFCISTAQRAWRHRTEGYHRTILESIASFVRAQGGIEKIDVDRFVRALESKAPSQWVQCGRRAQARNNPYQAVAEEMKREYNAVLRGLGPSRKSKAA